MVAYQQAGQSDRAEQLLKDHYKNYPDNPFIQEFSSHFYIVRKNFKQALAEIERGFSQDPAPENWSWDNLKGDVYLAQGDLAAAEKQYLGVIERALKPKYVSDATRNLIRLYILQGKMSRGADELARATAPGGSMQGTDEWAVAQSWLRLGRYDKALELFETQLKNASERDNTDLIFLALWNKGFVYVEKKSISEAEKIADELKSLGEKGANEDAMIPYATIQGRIDLEKGNCSKAIDNLNELMDGAASEVFGSIQIGYHIYPLALAYYKSGNLPKARAEFEKLTSLTAGRWDCGDFYAKGFYWLGKISEAQKDKRRARENYGKFLDLWKDADPGFPEVDDAKARLAALS
jgi:tetratricopeptide (TPR) repeat protein